MKALILSFLLLVPSISYAGIPMPELWTCMQVGFVGEVPTVILATLQAGNNPGKNYKDREKAFAQTVRKKWKLQGIYEPLCQDFQNKKEADEYFVFVKEKAKEQGLNIHLVDFQWKHTDVVQKE